MVVSLRSVVQDSGVTLWVLEWIDDDANLTCQYFGNATEAFVELRRIQPSRQSQMGKPH